MFKVWGLGFRGFGVYRVRRVFLLGLLAFTATYFGCTQP